MWEMSYFCRKYRIMVNIKDVVTTLERFAPLPLQESYDNAGLQIGLTVAEVSGVLLCLDVTEEVLLEAERKGCNVVVSHHPLLFRPLKHIGTEALVERCVRQALSKNIAVYSAHTNLDNAEDGVNYCIAERMGLENVSFLQPAAQGGSGVTGFLSEPMAAGDFLRMLKREFAVECLMHNEVLERPVRKVALCGGAGDFLLGEAVRQEADAVVTGEMHYHIYMGLEQKIQIAVMGHYQSEQYTSLLLESVLKKAHPSLKTVVSEVNTNPIYYLK